MTTAPATKQSPAEQVYRAVMQAKERGTPAAVRVPPAMYDAVCKQLGGTPNHIGGVPVHSDASVEIPTVDMAPAVSP